MKESLLHKLTKEQPERNTTCWRNIFILAIGMIQKETVCLNKIKGAVGAITGNTITKPVSHYKRLIRIFDSYAYSRLWLELLQFVFCSLRLKSDYLLRIARTMRHSPTLQDGPRFPLLSTGTMF